MNIKIGNDIRLNVVLNDKYNFELTDIKKIKAYLINTTNTSSCYPNQSYPIYYNASGFNTNLCGVPTYYTLPYDLGFNGYYTGFGYNPRHSCTCNCSMSNAFLAPHTVNKEEGSIQVFFPANQLLTTGTYKLTIVLEVYQYGWCNTNVRTYSYDYNNVFSLTEDGEDGDQIINQDGTSTVVTLLLTTTAPSIAIGSSSLIQAVIYRKDNTTSILTDTSIAKTSIKCYNADNSICSDQSIFTVSDSSVDNYYKLVNNISATTGQYCLVTAYYSDDPTKFDTVKITSTGSGTSTTAVVNNIDITPTSATINNGGNLLIESVVTGTNLTGGINVYY